jgi:hypothetical protein
VRPAMRGHASRAELRTDRLQIHACPAAAMQALRSARLSAFGPACSVRASRRKRELLNSGSSVNFPPRNSYWAFYASSSFASGRSARRVRTAMASNPSIERTSSSQLRCLAAAAHVER